MENILQILYVTLITSIVWFIIGGILYMNPIISRIYKKYNKHPSMKHFSSQRSYLVGVFFIAGFIPIFLTYLVYSYISPINIIAFGLLLSGVRIIPRLCDMWMQTSYPNKILAIELINGIILSFVIAFMFQLL